MEAMDTLIRDVTEIESAIDIIDRPLPFRSRAMVSPKLLVVNLAYLMNEIHHGQIVH